MKKSAILLLGILTVGLCLFTITVSGQNPIPNDSTITVPIKDATTDWIGALIGLVIAIVPTIAYAKGRFRLGKFVALAKITYDAMADRNIDANEQDAIKNALKDLIKKEDPDIFEK